MMNKAEDIRERPEMLAYLRWLEECSVETLFRKSLVRFQEPTQEVPTLQVPGTATCIRLSLPKMWIGAMDKPARL